MVRNYIQFTLRQKMEDNNETLPHPFTKKQERRLTTEIAMSWFADIIVVHAGFGDAPMLRQKTEDSLNSNENFRIIIPNVR